jgi:hypothetical protein
LRSAFDPEQKLALTVIPRRSGPALIASQLGADGFNAISRFNPLKSISCETFARHGGVEVIVFRKMIFTALALVAAWVLGKMLYEIWMSGQINQSGKNGIAHTYSYSSDQGLFLVFFSLRIIESLGGVLVLLGLGWKKNDLDSKESAQFQEQRADAKASVRVGKLRLYGGLFLIVLGILMFFFPALLRTAGLS